ASPFTRTDDVADAARPPLRRVTSDVTPPTTHVSLPPRKKNLQPSLLSVHLPEILIAVSFLFTITGTGFGDVGFGLPVANFTRGGVLIAQARASALTGNTTLTVPFPTAATAIAPNLPGLSAGPVQAQVYIQTGSVTYTLIGSVSLAITDTRI